MPKAASPACWIPEDRFEDHVADTLMAGGALVRSRGRRDGGARGAAADQRADRLGHAASIEHTGTLALGREGGHGHHRIVHALGDATGKEVMRAVIDRARAAAEHRDLGKHLHARPADARRASAAGAWSADEHGKTMVWAKQTILATGGAGSIYRETTNPAVATGDGMPSPTGPGPSCATWSSCSSIPPCSTSPAAAAA